MKKDEKVKKFAFNTFYDNHIVEERCTLCTQLYVRGNRYLEEYRTQKVWDLLGVSEGTMINMTRMHV